MSESQAVVCPECGANASVRIMYGMPSQAGFEAAQRGELALGGCSVELTSPDWHCRRCGHDWADGTTFRRILESQRGITNSE